jgi:hypothetical protein
MRRISLVTALTLCVSVAAHTVVPLNLNTGLWEVTTTTGDGDDNMLPAVLLQKLTSEERARVELRMKARSADPQKTINAKQCLTKQELERGMLFRPVQKSCSWAVLTSTSSRMEMRGKCVDHGMKTERTLRIDTLSPEEAEGSLQFFTESQGTTPATTSTFKAKWIGPLCRTR